MLADDERIRNFGLDLSAKEAVEELTRMMEVPRCRGGLPAWLSGTPLHNFCSRTIPSKESNAEFGVAACWPPRRLVLTTAAAKRCRNSRSVNHSGGVRRKYVPTYESTRISYAEYPYEGSAVRVFMSLSPAERTFCRVPDTMETKYASRKRGFAIASIKCLVSRMVS